jgi:NAD(P)-dependent dehydrogenase (short-subunit alcohol dehydrogenase family)
MKLENQVAIVVGASQVIGATIARTFSEEGANIALVGRVKPELDKVAEDIRRKAGKAIAIVADITDEEQVKNMVDETIKAYGRIDILVNSAGFTGPTCRVDEIDEKDWDAVLDVNLKGPFLCCKMVLKHMIKQHSGNIVNMSGTAGKEGLPLRGALSAAKWGLLGLTQVIAKECGQFNIRANCIVPSGIYGPRMQHVFVERAKVLGTTPEEVERWFMDRTPLRRFSHPEEVARAILFLASDDSCNITGEALNFSGGEIMH